MPVFQYGVTTPYSVSDLLRLSRGTVVQLGTQHPKLCLTSLEPQPRSWIVAGTEAMLASTTKGSAKPHPFLVQCSKHSISSLSQLTFNDSDTAVPETTALASEELTRRAVENPTNLFL